MRDGNNVSGTGRTTCPYYEELDAILGTRAASSPPVLLDSGGGTQVGSEVQVPMDDDEDGMS